MFVWMINIFSKGSDLVCRFSTHHWYSTLIFFPKFSKVYFAYQKATRFTICTTLTALTYNWRAKSATTSDNHTRVWKAISSVESAQRAEKPERKICFNRTVSVESRSCTVDGQYACWTISLALVNLVVRGCLVSCQNIQWQSDEVFHTYFSQHSKSSTAALRTDLRPGVINKQQVEKSRWALHSR